MSRSTACSVLVWVVVLGGLGGCKPKVEESPFTESLVVMVEGTKLLMAPADFAGVVDQLALGTQVMAVPADTEVVYDTTYAEVELAYGRTGFIERTLLGPQEEWQQVEDLRSDVAGLQVQAVGTITARSNLRLEPQRDSRVIDSVPGKTAFEMYRRVASMDGDTKEIWYLVDLGEDRVGYLFTRQLDFEPPRDLPGHARYRRKVAWHAMGGAEEHPTWLVASAGDGDLGCDFDQVEIYAWDPSTGAYGTMFHVEDLKAVLPVDVEERDGVWHFVLREMGEGETVATRWSDTRPAKVVETWTEPASPYLH
jgi:hypothetical protein